MSAADIAGSSAAATPRRSHGSAADDGTITGIVYIATPLPDSGLPANIILQLAGAALLALLLASIAGRFLARQIARPLEGLAQAARGIARGDLNVRPPTETDITELHGLTQTFESMADNLRQSDETKKAFIADVTHGLRTPLTVIKGTIETLEDTTVLEMTEDKLTALLEKHPRVREVLQKYSEMRLKGTIETVISKSVE